MAPCWLRCTWSYGQGTGIWTSEIYKNLLTFDTKPATIGDCMKVWICKHCLQEKRIAARGMCDACYRWTSHDRSYTKPSKSRSADSRPPRKINPEVARRRKLLWRLRKYGISEDFYLEQLKWGCAICRSFDRLHVDHDHSTWLFRGILCHKCNLWIGMLDDSIPRLEAARIYIITHNTLTRQSDSSDSGE